MTIDFVTSATGPDGFPRERLPEVAVVGRSNVGKSTLINTLGRRKVARTSAAPGKTRLVNFYRVTADGSPPFFLVDLPGYGYARGGDAARRDLEAIASAYFEARRRDQAPSGAAAGRTSPRSGLAGVLLLVDSRHPDLDADHDAWRWLRGQGASPRVVATKLDKLTRAERVRHLNELERLYESPVLGVSAQTGEGMKDLWKTIDALLRP